MVWMVFAVLWVVMCTVVFDRMGCFEVGGG